MGKVPRDKRRGDGARHGQLTPPHSWGGGARRRRGYVTVSFPFIPDCSCPGWSQKNVYWPAARLSTVNASELPACMSSLAATRLLLPSRMMRSCAADPELTSQKVTLPAGTLTVSGL